MTKKETKKKGSALQIVLTVLLVGAAFAIGSMWTELRVYKKTAKQEVQAPRGDEQTAELSKEMWEEVVKGGIGQGKEDAKVTIVEFTDYQCPFCKRYTDQAYQQIKTEYIKTGKVRYILRDLPLGQLHANAQKAAEAARCAGEQDKYFEMHDKLFEMQTDWAKVSDNSFFKTYAGQLGLDLSKFNSCLDDGKQKESVKADLALAQKVGANGTPTFFINGKKLVGAQQFETFKTVIDDSLNN